ncbi:hypothetical protein PIB30_115518, partial [Stylosanthes scabra]|nr:hypothetical protein [Stylosanthes scabra]
MCIQLADKSVKHPYGVVENLLVKVVINVFEAMQHPADEETEECMRTDIIDMLVKEIQEEDMLK